MTMKTMGLLLTVTTLIFAGAQIGYAGNVLLIGPSPSLLFNDGLSQYYGHSVTIGPNYDVFDGSTDLSPYDVVVLSAADYQRPDMPVSGQDNIVNFVASGGGFVTGEWVLWMMVGPNFTNIEPLLPATSVGGAYLDASVGPVVFAPVTPDPILNAGMPTSFNISTSPGTSIIQPRAGATVFYSGDEISGLYPSAGLVGWQHGLGRVLSFSTPLQYPSASDYSDPYSRLINNAINWAGANASSAAVPEPSTLVISSILLGLFAMSRVRKRAKRTTTAV